MTPALSRLLALASVFASAFLLFLLEPMVGKMLLPDFGGSPAVWGTCLMFFQGLLLLGYGYGHLLAGLPARIAVRAHLIALLVPLAVLPFAVSGAHAPAAGAWPVPALLGALAATAALPFFALSTNTSLVQDWYARRRGVEPYFLYAASNAGSLLALMAYPFVVERVMGLRAQSRTVAAGYVLFVVLTAATAFALRAVDLAPRERAVATVVPLRRRLRWLVLSAIGSLLLLAVTMHISSELAAVPLLWVLPLALYLLTFVIAFLDTKFFARPVLTLIAALLITLALFAASVGMREPFLRSLVVALATIFVGALLCHGDLARDRPGPGEVTSFYLWIAAGGFLGGVLGSLVAPVVFSTVAEWPLSLVAIALVAATADGGAELLGRLRTPRWWIGPAVFVGILGGAVAMRSHGGSLAKFSGLAPLVVLLAGVILWRVPGLFLAGACTVAGFTLSGFNDGWAHPLEVRRSFFGVVRVVQSEDGFRAMYHGQTIHGAQLAEPFSPRPLLYYTPEGPMGQAVLHAPANARIALIGMGAGSLAAVGRHGQSLTYYEIDPIVEPMARAWFSYLPKSEAAVTTVLGDARLTLRSAPNGAYDLIIVDAFSGDAVPAHLLTVEAIALYLSRLDPHGLLLLHVSNRYLTLVPLLQGAARELGVRGAVIDYVPPEESQAPSGDQREHWAAANVVVALAPDPTRLDALLAGAWTPLLAQPHTPIVWTDDRSSLLDVLN